LNRLEGLLIWRDIMRDEKMSADERIFMWLLVHSIIICAWICLKFEQFERWIESKDF
jgi:hypothetical protein